MNIKIAMAIPVGKNRKRDGIKIKAKFYNASNS